MKTRFLNVLLFAASPSIAGAVTIAFNTAADYDNNFREYTNAPSTSWVSSGGGRLEKGVENSATTMLYNTTSTGGAGGSGGTGVGTNNNNTFNNFTIQMDFASDALGSGGNSLGFYSKLNASGIGYATIFRLTDTGAADFRIYDSDSNATTGALSNNATPISTQLFTVPGGSFAAGTSYTFKLSVEDIGSNVRFTGGIYNAVTGVQIGNSLTYTDTISAVTGAGQVGLRLGTNLPASNFYDNFAVNPIPEPAAALLGAIGGLVLLRRKRN